MDIVVNESVKWGQNRGSIGYELMVKVDESEELTESARSGQPRKVSNYLDFYW